MTGARSPRRGALGAFQGGQGSQFGAGRLRRGDDEVRHLVAGLGACLERGTLDHVQGPDRLDDRITGLRDATGLAGQHRPGRRL